MREIGRPYTGTQSGVVISFSSPILPRTAQGHVPARRGQGAGAFETAGEGSQDAKKTRCACIEYHDCRHEHEQPDNIC
jgi:hypothetical protein